MRPPLYWGTHYQHQGSLFLVIGCLLLVGAAGSFYGSRRFLRQASSAAWESCLPLRGRWLRLLALPLLICFVLLLGLAAAGVLMWGLESWAEAARY